MADVVISLGSGSYDAGDVVYVWDEAEIAQQWANLVNGNHPLLPSLLALYPKQDQSPLLTEAAAAQARADGIVLPGGVLPVGSAELKHCCVIRVGNVPIDGKLRFMAPLMETAVLNANGEYAFSDGTKVVWRTVIQNLLTRQLQNLIAPPKLSSVPSGWDVAEGPFPMGPDGNTLPMDSSGRPMRQLRRRRAFCDLTAHLSSGALARLQDPGVEVDLRKELPPFGVTVLTER